MATKLEFKCPKCKGSKIEEIMVDMSVVSEVGGVEMFDDGTVECVYGKQTNDDGHVDRYQCGECGHTIVDGDSSFADEGLDINALVKAILAINNSPKGNLVSHDELVQRFADGLGNTDGEELARIWNYSSPHQVVYEGDSHGEQNMYRWVLFLPG